MILRVAAAQISPRVGDLEANAQLILAAARKADDAGSQLTVFPELAVCGYPPEDLLLRGDFLQACSEALEAVRAGHRGASALIVGTPAVIAGRLMNAAAVISGGRVAAVIAKQHLPSYGVFDEQRLFQPGPASRPFQLGPVAVGVTICEDLWVPAGPAQQLAGAGASLIVNLSASPFHAGKQQVRRELVAVRARECVTPVVYCNQACGQDELVFDGGSMIAAHDGSLLAEAAQFEPETLTADISLHAAAGARRSGARPAPAPAVPASGRAPLAPGPARQAPGTGPRCELPRAEQIYRALVTALRDYAAGNGFSRALIGLSGGADSALAAAVACDALGPAAVTAVVMPSPHSSRETQSDARAMAAGLGMDLREIPIAGPMQAFQEALDGRIGPAGHEPDVTAQNLQARIRGSLLMAISNREGHLLVSTGNKSEMACGYATLYGDMSGGFALLKDVPKTDVFALMAWRNAQAGGPVIPAAVLARPPSAELAPGQLDTDSLPGYDELDPILEALVSDDLSVSQAAALGHDEATVRRVARLVGQAEYKRRQAPPGPKVTTRAFGRDRRVPITSAFRVWQR